MKFCETQAALNLLAALAITAHAAEPAEKLNFDSVHVGEVVQRELAIANTSDKPLAVKEVNSSCSCVRIVSVSRTVAPHTSGTLTLEYKPAKAGKTEIEILVALDPANVSAADFRWAGEVLPPLAPGTLPIAAAPAAPDTSDTSISPKELAAILAESHGMLVDIRDPAQYHLGSIDGAVNWPVSILRTLSSLKVKPLILTGSGSDDAAARQAALELRQAGFQSVKVLRGGLRMWWAANPGGNRPPVAAMVSSTSVGSVEYLSSSQDEWMVVHIQGVAGAFPKVARIPGAVMLALGPEFPKTLVTEVLQATTARPLISKILMVSDDGSSYEAVESNLPADLPVPVFYLKGGALAYRAAVDQGLAQKNQRTANVSTTGLNRGNPETRVFSSGCNTCPRQPGSLPSSSSMPPIHR